MTLEEKLLWAIERQYENDEIMEILANPHVNINYKCNFGRTALLNAIRAGNNQIIKMLLSRKDINVSLKSNCRETSLHFACESRTIPLEIVKLLIDKQKDHVNATCAGLGYTPIFHTIKANRLDLVKLLVENECNINQRDHCGQTVLHNAASLTRCDIIEYLLDHTAIDPKIISSFGQTALDTMMTDFDPEDYIAKIPIYIKLLNRTIEVDPETQKYGIGVFFEPTVLACSKNFIQEEFIKKFYYTNNSRYHMIEKLEEYWPRFARYGFGDLHFLYAFMHDEVTKERVENIIKKNGFFYTDLFAYCSCVLILNSVLSDEINSFILELLHYFASLGFYDIVERNHFLQKRFENKIGTALSSEEISSKSISECRRIYKIINFVNQKGFDVNLILSKLLDYTNLLNHENFIKKMPIIRILIPFSTNYMDILLKFYLKKSEDPEFKDSIQHFIQQCGDNSKFQEVARLAGIDLSVHSLKHISRNVIRSKLLQSAKTSTQLFKNLNSLELPKPLNDYMKLHDLHGVNDEKAEENEDLPQKKRKLQ